MLHDYPAPEHGLDDDPRAESFDHHQHEAQGSSIRPFTQYGYDPYLLPAQTSMTASLPSVQCWDYFDDFMALDVQEFPPSQWTEPLPSHHTTLAASYASAD